MPTNAPRVKLDATRGYGAEVITYDKPGESARRSQSASPPSAGSR